MANFPGTNHLLTTALVGALLPADVPEGQMVRAWLDSWAGVGQVVDAMRSAPLVDGSIMRSALLLGVMILGVGCAAVPVVEAPSRPASDPGPRLRMEVEMERWCRDRGLYALCLERGFLPWPSPQPIPPGGGW